MSILEIKMRSGVMMRPMEFAMFLPDDQAFNFSAQNNPCYDRPMKTLIILHGYTVDNYEWMSYSTPYELALRYNLAVVIPSTDSSFYLDRPGTGNKVGSCVGKELIEYLRRTFGLAKTPEDTIISGYSMGGFGAIHTALAYPETFGCALGLSSALIVYDIAGMKPGIQQEGVLADYDYYREVFGDLDKVTESENNPEVLVSKLLAEGKKIPRLYMTCGDNDFLLQTNKRFLAFLEEKKVPVTFVPGEGVHDFVFWNKAIGPAVEWALGGK